MHTVQFLTSIVEHHQILAYTLIFIGLLFEGEFFIISTGVLAHLGALNFWLSLILILGGAMCKTLLGYYVGVVIRNKWPNSIFIKYIVKRGYHFMPHFHEKPFWSIFISKFLVGTNSIVMIFSGYERLAYRKYLEAEALATVLWAPGMLSLGYFFSYTALRVSREVRTFLIIVLVLVILFFLFDKFITWLYELFEEFYHDRK